MCQTIIKFWKNLVNNQLNLRNQNTHQLHNKN